MCVCGWLSEFSICFVYLNNEMEHHRWLNCLRSSFCFSVRGHTHEPCDWLSVEAKSQWIRQVAVQTFLNSPAVQSRASSSYPSSQSGAPSHKY